MAYQAINQVFHEIIEWINKAFKNSKWMMYVGLVAAIFLTFFILRSGYHWHTNRVNAAAQQAFSSAMEHFSKAQSSKTDMWADVAAEFKMGYEQHSSSSLAPYFLAYQAQALLQQGNRHEAITVLETAIKDMSSSSPLFSIYKTQKALIKLDSEDGHMREHGLQELIALSQDTKNQHRDEALYYLGLHYMNSGNIAQAQIEWRTLVQAFPARGQSASIYADLAQSRLDQIA